MWTRQTSRRGGAQAAGTYAKPVSFRLSVGAPPGSNDVPEDMTGGDPGDEPGGDMPGDSVIGVATEKGAGPVLGCGKPLKRKNSVWSKARMVPPDRGAGAAGVRRP